MMQGREKKKRLCSDVHDEHAVCGRRAKQMDPSSFITHHSPAFSILSFLNKTTIYISSTYHNTIVQKRNTFEGTG